MIDYPHQRYKNPSSFACHGQVAWASRLGIQTWWVNLNPYPLVMSNIAIEAMAQSK